MIVSGSSYLNVFRNIKRVLKMHLIFFIHEYSFEAIKYMIFLMTSDS